VKHVPWAVCQMKLFVLYLLCEGHALFVLSWAGARSGVVVSCLMHTERVAQVLGVVPFLCVVCILVVLV
jgi:hypothetical protein